MRPSRWRPRGQSERSCPPGSRVALRHPGSPQLEKSLSHLQAMELALLFLKCDEYMTDLSLRFWSRAPARAPWGHQLSLPFQSSSFNMEPWFGLTVEGWLLANSG